MRYIMMAIIIVALGTIIGFVAYDGVTCKALANQPTQAPVAKETVPAPIPDTISKVQDGYTVIGGCCRVYCNTVVCPNCGGTGCVCLEQKAPRQPLLAGLFHRDRVRTERVVVREKVRVVERRVPVRKDVPACGCVPTCNCGPKVDVKVKTNVSVR